MKCCLDTKQLKTNDKVKRTFYFFHIKQTYNFSNYFINNRTHDSGILKDQHIKEKPKNNDPAFMSVMTS